jgi:hypothetical protein
MTDVKVSAVLTAVNIGCWVLPEAQWNLFLMGVSLLEPPLVVRHPLTAARRVVHLRSWGIRPGAFVGTEDSIHDNVRREPATAFLAALTLREKCFSHPAILPANTKVAFRQKKTDR